MHFQDNIFSNKMALYIQCHLDFGKVIPNKTETKVGERLGQDRKICVYGSRLFFKNGEEV